MRTAIPLFLLASAALADPVSRPPVSQFAGEWSGSCRSVMAFLRGDLPVRLHIEPDGSVTGTVGNARIIKGRIRERSWAEPRAMNHFEYKVEFRLEGPLSREAQVTRSGGRINLDFDGDNLKGWFVSNGPKIGGSKSMQITTRDLILRRTRE